jgi:ectoine hydroxylase-related dioxygenase (phytanoyl-CoA dioxygenase family)
MESSKRIKTEIDFAELRETLERDGYAVVRGAVSEEKCEEIYGHFMKYMEDLSCGRFDRNDRATWIEKNMPISTRGLIQHWNIGFQRHAVEARMAVKYIFEELHGTKKLTSSFDGTSFTRPGKVFHYKDMDDWDERCWDKTTVHIDQTTPGFTSIQGGLAVTDQNIDEHVFLCVPGSHKFHEQLLAISEREIAEENAKLQQEVKDGKRKSYSKKKLELHWSIMGKKHIALLRENNLFMHRVSMQRGDFVLWQSRLVHSSAPYCKTARKDALRLQVFVSMAPAVRDREEIRLRNEAYTKGLVSKHSADRIRLFPKMPRIYGKDGMEIYQSLRIPPSAPLSDEEKRVHGLLPYPKE